VQHVIARSIPELLLFRDEQDRRVFTGMLVEQLTRTGYQLLNKALQDNHYHLVVRANEQKLEKLCRTLNSRYARYYNKRHNRRGTLFESRPVSIVAESATSAKNFIRYVSLNPLRSGYCRSLEQLDRYRWSGHAALMGHIEMGHIDVRKALSAFGKTIEEARANYLAFVLEGLKSKHTDPIVKRARRRNKGHFPYDDPSCSALGTDGFIRKLIARDGTNKMRLSRLKRANWDLEKLAAYVARRMGIEPGRLRYRYARGPIGPARRAFAYLGYRVMGVTQVKLGGYLGVSGSAVSSMVARGEAVAKDNGLTDIPA
jgi:hypothetical protein